MRQRNTCKVLSKIMTMCLVATLLISTVLTSGALAKSGIPLKEKYLKHKEQKTVEYLNIENYSNDYHNYRQECDKNGYKDTEGIEIKLTPDDIIAPNDIDGAIKKNFDDKDNVLIWDNQEYFEWKVNVPESGLYEIYIEYRALNGSSNTIQREVLIDDEVPFEEALNIPLYRFWEDEHEPLTNREGDQIRPKQIEIFKWDTIALTDIQGINTTGLKFYLEKGEHKLRLNHVDQPVAISNIYICSPKVIPTYEEVLDTYRNNGYEDSTVSIEIEAEKTAYKNDSTLRRENTGDPVASPPSIDVRKLNMIGGWRFRKGNQTITWDIDVQQSGLYKLAFRIEQDYGDGLTTFEQLKIDGQVPYQEMLCYPFEYKNSWRTEVLSNDKDEPYLFYLDKGKHEISMTVKMGPLQEVIRSIKYTSLTLSNLTKKIIMITGSQPDSNFDYELDIKIPGLIDNLQKISDNVGEQVEALRSLAVKRPTILNNFVMLREQLAAMIKDPYIIPTHLGDLTTAQNSLSTSLSDLQNRPIDIDYFKFVPPTEEVKDYRSNIFQRIYVSWKNFIKSFYKDYDNINSVSDSEEKENTSINVWIGRGKEWGETMKLMADEQFTPSTGIGVNINILPAGQLGANGVNPLLLSIVSGKAPNVACGVPAGSPVELAIRKASLDLKQFDGYKSVSNQFLPGVLMPFEYNNGVYAFPETMDFQVLFYRKDIIDELGIDIPDTWQDVYKNVLPLLNQNGMEFYYTSVTENIATAGAGYLPFLYQNSGTFYTDDGLRTALDTDMAYNAFMDWTKLFKVYKLPVRADFYNRFRTGEAPMGIGDYNLYMRIMVAAPELLGRWGIANIPGTLKEDGTIDRTSGGLPTATMILEQGGKKEESWKFMEWWLSKSVQASFGQELESLIGPEARWNTANMEAYKELPWDKKDLKVMEKQWQWFKEQPIVLGGYFSNRHIRNAWTSVVMSDVNERDALEKAVKDINKELKLKQEEYGVK